VLISISLVALQRGHVISIGFNINHLSVVVKRRRISEGVNTALKKDRPG
jgi:hypothetical protein